MAALALASASVLAAPVSSGKSKAAAETRSLGHAIEYTDLEQRVGAEIAVETVLGTVRRGTLVKYTNPGLTLQLGPDHGSIELSIPRDTVRSVRLIDAASTPQPQTEVQQEQGNSRAQKN